MIYKDLVVRSLKNHKVTSIESPLGNEFILDDEWHMEMDCDGAFAMTISRCPQTGEMTRKKAFIVFSATGVDDEKTLEEIARRIENEISKLRMSA